MTASNIRFRWFLLMLLVAVLAVAGLLLSMWRLVGYGPITVEQVTPVSSAPQAATSPSAANSLPLKQEIGADEIVVTVNEQVITRQQWQEATRLDAAMSRVTNQPVPSAEETLDRMVSEIIILAQAPQAGSPSAAEIEERIAALEKSWDISDQMIMDALEEASLNRDHLVARVGRLLEVEAGLEQLSAQGQDLKQWLVGARTAAEISLYQPLVAPPLPQTAPLEDASPKPPVMSLADKTKSTMYPLKRIDPHARSPDLPVSPYPEQVAPDFSLPATDGSALTLSDFRGRPALINFWASWCPPWRQDLPALQAVYDTYGHEIGFVAVNVKEPVHTVTTFATEMGLTFPIALDPEGHISDEMYQVRGIPTTIFVDARGVVKARHVGPLDEAAIRGYLAPLLR
jgi:thiol-disulfide isomerase/thioredoxin